MAKNIAKVEIKASGRTGRECLKKIRKTLEEMEQALKPRQQVDKK